MFHHTSQRLSEFWGRKIVMNAGVALPPNWNAQEQLPICYSVHGFGGDHLAAWNQGVRQQEKLGLNDYPRMVYVYLDGSCFFGHHEFADSVNNGPWGAAFVEEFAPALESQWGGIRPPEHRYITGHSSGGWSSLWLQVTYPDSFGGCWSTAPDPVDFRDFSGVDIYSEANLFQTSQGEKNYLILRNGEPLTTFEEYLQGEEQTQSRPGGVGGQMFSFDAVFSPRGDNGLPQPMFDRKTGKIDPCVAQAWREYDISQYLRENWSRLQPKLQGRLHVWCGEWDTFQLAGAVKLLKQDLEQLQSDADVLLVPERDHASLSSPHPELWPEGMLTRIHREMHHKWMSTRTSPND